MIVSDDAFAYLKLQKGSLDHIAGDRTAWCAAYEASLQADFDSMAPYLPAIRAGRHVLDVGSGLGGIDVLFDRHYGGIGVHLLDGVDDAPRMTLHRRTFNDMKVAFEFMGHNGVAQVCHVGMPPGAARPMDIVISLGSWCFHYSPVEYLSFVRNCCTAATVMIVDVRADKPEWLAMLASQFVIVGCALSRPKFNRMVFRAA